MLSILIFILFFVIYALVHSLLAAEFVKDWVREKFGPSSDRWYRLFYNIFAVVSLLPLLPLLEMLPKQRLYTVPNPWRWLMRAGQILALLGLVGSVWQTGLSHFLGLRQLFDSEPEESGGLSVKGFYSWVRHPLYSFSLLFLWLSPTMNLSRLIFYLLCTLYFYFGSMHEEQRLIDQFGEAYRTYRQKVPRFIPWPNR